MLSDLIYREDAKDYARHAMAKGLNVLEYLDEVPTADFQPVVRGKWVYDHWCEFKCSNCGAWSKSEPYRGRENFCPNCGACMEES